MFTSVKTTKLYFLFFLFFNALESVGFFFVFEFLQAFLMFFMGIGGGFDRFFIFIAVRKSLKALTIRKLSDIIM